MTLAISEDHQALGDTARRFLAARSPSQVVRAALEAEVEELPPFWAELAGMGWLGLHLDPSYGGSGGGLPELAVVLEEMGRAGAPGPFLASVITSALIGRAGSESCRRAWLPGLADGTLIGTVALPGAGRLAVERTSGGPVVTGTLRPVLSAALAGIVIAPLDDGDGPAWWVLPVAPGPAGPPATGAKEVASLDPVRRVGELDFSRHPLEPDGRLDVTDDEVAAVASVLVAAEAAGGAGWCVDTAAEYARTRVQFGRPIGQFQAVKHRCAGMLIALEQIRAAAWDAAQAMEEDRGRPAEPSLLAAAIAAAAATEHFPAVAKDCIQVLGGIGFTWEHDAHLYLRRAYSLAALLGGPAGWRRRSADLATRGVRPGRAERAPTVGQESLRAEIAAAVDRIARRPKDQWRTGLVETGLLVAHWPVPWGRGAGAVEQLIIDEELARRGIRRPNLAVGAWAAPTIAAHGTADQQERWVGPTLLGRIKWCQLFSEPEAGSDLASLRTRAEPVEGGWRLEGQKVWTSLAADADYGICVARSDPRAPKHSGITYFVVDMRSPGIEIRPLRELTGLAMFNEVFLNGVFVPDDHVIGEVHGGWALARTTLANERVAMGSGSSFGGGMEAVLGLVAEHRAAGALADGELEQLGGLVAEGHCLSVMGRRSAFRAVAGARPGPESSVRKLLGAEHDQRAQEFGLGLLGPEAATVEGAAAQWSFGFLANRCLTIAGGTSEVQRNVIGERLLGLPRDPEG